jgi:hypothetical protein
MIYIFQCPNRQCGEGVASENLDEIEQWEYDHEAVHRELKDLNATLQYEADEKARKAVMNMHRMIGDIYDHMSGGPFS